MNIEIINDIFENYLDNNYIKTITLIEEYFKTKYLGIYDKILDIYIDCQIQLGYYTEAKKNISIMTNIFPNYYQDYDLTKLYAKCNNIEELKQLLHTADFVRNLTN